MGDALMIEEIQALMPLFERISEGALWGVFVYIGTSLISNLAWPVVFAVAVIVAARKAAVIWGPTPPSNDQPRIDFYNLSHKGNDLGIAFLGEKNVMADFLKEAAKRAAKGTITAANFSAICWTWPACITPT